MEWATGMRTWPCKVFLFILASDFFIRRKILRPGDSGLTSPKEGMLGIFITLKNLSPQLGLIQRTLSPEASTPLRQ
jgi:hypothetical protein